MAESIGTSTPVAPSTSVSQVLSSTELEGLENMEEAIELIKKKNEKFKKKSAFRLRLLSWNIDGLDGNNLKERAESVCHFIQHHEPHVVFLQEVVYKSLAIIKDALNPTYTVYFPPKIIDSYFTAIVIKNCSAIHIEGEVGQLDFPGSTMGRHLLQMCVKVCGTSLALYTSHLESMKDYSDERKAQLKLCFELIEEQRTSFQKNCIFGGDLNVRDYEVIAVGLPESTVDVWEACGKRIEHQYTWDTSENDNLNWPYSYKPRLRFDRIYLTRFADYVKPRFFQLVGKDRLFSCNCFISDHWGLWAEFDVSES